jgi:hypothetical protein
MTRGFPQAPRLGFARFRLPLLARILLLWVPLLPNLPAVAQQVTGSEDDGAGEIQDNSFLLEEAYNQEAGVIQHIFAFERERGTGNWYGSFTEEWPLGGPDHQISASIPFVRFGEGEGGNRVGDLLLNYRYQLTGPEGPVAVSPRLSVVLPTGDEETGAGTGGTGIQVNFPVSVQASRRLVAHWNAGATYTFGAKGPDGERGGLQSYSVGNSWVYLATHNFNVFCEALFTSTETIAANRERIWENSVTLNPGVRFAIDFPSGLQVVPGISFPIGVGPSRGERGVFLYLSFEHPFGPAGSR